MASAYISQQAFVVYFDDTNDLVYMRFRCNPKTGVFEERDSQILTSNLSGYEVVGHPDSSAAAVLLGATDGIRLYIHDKHKAIHSIMFTNERGWDYEQLVSPDTKRSGHFISVVNRVAPTNKLIIITPKDTENMEMIALQNSGLWQTSKSLQ